MERVVELPPAFWIAGRVISLAGAGMLLLGMSASMLRLARGSAPAALPGSDAGLTFLALCSVFYLLPLLLLSGLFAPHDLIPLIPLLGAAFVALALRPHVPARGERVLRALAFALIAGMAVLGISV
jgi:hypothetical protein